MFWSKKKDNDAEIKEKMIRDLRSAFPSLRRPNNDDTVFEILFEVNRQYHTLRVYLSNEFPTSRPILQVVGDFRHPWLDQYKRVVGSTMLRDWSKSSSLADVVMDVLGQLQPPSGGARSMHRDSIGSQQASRDSTGAPPSFVQPPVSQPAPVVTQTPSANAAAGPPAYNSLGSATTPAGQHTMMSAYASRQQAPVSQPPPRGYGAPGLPPPPAYESVTGKTAPAPTLTGEAPTSQPAKRQISKPVLRKTDIPPIPSSFSELDTMTELQLEKLLNDDVALKAHVKASAVVKNMSEPLGQFHESNKKDAESLLAMKADLSKLREETLATQQELREAVSKYRERASLMSARYSVNRADVLKDAAAEREKLDNEAEELAEKFTMGEVDVNSFLTDYVKMRSDYHALNIKLACVERDRS